jgi:hypothetical protein
MAMYVMNVRLLWQFGFLIPVFMKIRVLLDMVLQACKGWYLLQGFGNCLQKDVGSYPRRLESSGLGKYRRNTNFL